MPEKEAGLSYSEAGRAGVTVVGDFRDLQAAWNSLERTGVYSPFQTFAWMSVLMDTIGRADHVIPKIVVLRDDAGAPFMIVPLVVEVVHGIRVLKFMDFGVSDYNGALMRRDFAAGHAGRDFYSLWQEIVDALAPIDAIQLEKLPEKIDGVSNPFLQLPCIHTLNAYAARLGESPSAFLTGLSSKRKATLRRARRRLAEQGDLEFRVATDEPEARRFVDWMILHKRHRYRTTGSRDIFNDPRYEHFYHEFARREVAGSAHLSALLLDGEPVSVSLSLRHKNCLYYLMPSFDAAYARYSPGQQHISDLIEWCYARSISTLDFTWGDEAYKTQWANEVHRLYLHCSSLTVRGRIWCSCVHGRRKLKSWAAKYPWLLETARVLRGRTMA